MNWNYYACSNCTKTFRTTINNPDGHIKCPKCGYSLYIAISKDEYDESRRSATIVRPGVK